MQVAGEQDTTVREDDRGVADGVRLMLDDLARHGTAVLGQRGDERDELERDARCALRRHRLRPLSGLTGSVGAIGGGAARHVAEPGMPEQVVPVGRGAEPGDHRNVEPVQVIGELVQIGTIDAGIDQDQSTLPAHRDGIAPDPLALPDPDTVGHLAARNPSDAPWIERLVHIMHSREALCEDPDGDSELLEARFRAVCNHLAIAEALKPRGWGVAEIQVMSGELRRLRNLAIHSSDVSRLRLVLDRLGRSLRHLLTVLAELSERGVTFRSLTEAIDTTTAAGRLQVHLFAALAEFERSLGQERTRAGLEAARARGRTGGRPAVVTSRKLAPLWRRALRAT